MPKQNIKPPVKSKSSFPRKKSVSLTDAQYEDIFAAVINAPKIIPEDAPKITPESKIFASPTVGEQPPEQEAASPKECASVENSQKSGTVKARKKNKKNIESSTLSTLESEDITKNAVCSTPDKVFEPKSFHQALKSLKQKLTDSFSDVTMTDSFNMSLIEVQCEEPLSQPPKTRNRKERLLWLQKRRGQGLYVQCGKVKCKKWRWLENADPVDLPEYWICEMNPNKKYASCSIPQKQIPVFVENDLISGIYTAGSIVWAKIPGYPWWPAMVDDCPDCEQYYWINNPIYDEPDWYHVVFFDADEVSRSWVLVKDIKAFKYDPNFDAKHTIRNKYKYRMTIAKRQAASASLLQIKERLSLYSFISQWKNDLPDYSESDSSEFYASAASSGNQIRIKKKKHFKQRTNKRRKISNTSSDNSSFEQQEPDKNASLRTRNKNKELQENNASLKDIKKKTMKINTNINEGTSLVNTSANTTPKKVKPGPKSKTIKLISTRRQSANSTTSVEKPRDMTDTQKIENVSDSSAINFQMKVIEPKKKKKFFNPPTKKN